MTHVVVDAAMLGKLHQLSQPLELRDTSGRVLAHLYPALDLSRCEPLVPQVSEQELDRREHANEKRYTTAEVLARLERQG